MQRRNFVKWLTASGGAFWTVGAGFKWLRDWGLFRQRSRSLVLSTWNFETANKTAWDAMGDGQTALDAVEAGIRVEESDPDNHTVGYGGRPDREGTVSLDAAVMNEEGEAGGVACLRGFKHPVSAARKVMEETPHVLLSGTGAEQFALDSGCTKKELLTDESERNYKEWLKHSEYQPKINIEQHDTIGLIALDKEGHLAAGCSTSGLAYKMAGRVADSCLVGSGIYLDPNTGAAVATGYGEHIMKTAGSFLAVEEMRRGADPESACERSIRRIHERTPRSDYQAAIIACNLYGDIGAYSMKNGFRYVLSRSETPEVRRADYLLRQ